MPTRGRVERPPIIMRVTPEKMFENWRYIGPLIERVLNKIDSGIDERSLIQGIRNCEYQLWAVNDFEAIAVTSIDQRVTYTAMNILFLSGSGIDHWLSALVKVLNDFARGYECKYLEFYGRDGWDRKAPNVGFHKRYTVMCKRVE